MKAIGPLSALIGMNECHAERLSKHFHSWSDPSSSVMAEAREVASVLDHERHAGSHFAGVDKGV